MQFGMGFNFFAKDKTLTDENIIEHFGKVKTERDFYDFVSRAKELGTELASRVIGDFFVNSRSIGKRKLSPVFIGPNDFAADPKRVYKMFEAGFDALTVTKGGARQLVKMLENEDSYSKELTHVASHFSGTHREVSLPKYETHEDDVIAALLARGENGDEAAYYELGYNVGSTHPQKVRYALEKLDSDYAVTTLHEVAFSRTTISEGIDNNKIMALGGLLNIFDKYESGEFKNIDPKHVRETINGVCKALLNADSICAIMDGEKRSEFLRNDDERVQAFRNMLDCVDKKLGHEDYKYAKQFDLTIELYDRTSEEKQELGSKHEKDFQELEDMRNSTFQVPEIA